MKFHPIGDVPAPWPICAVCRDYVEEIATERDILSYRLVILVRCHGGIAETHVVPRECEGDEAYKARVHRALEAGPWRTVRPGSWARGRQDKHSMDSGDVEPDPGLLEGEPGL